MSLSDDRLDSIETRLARIENILNIVKPVTTETSSDIGIIWEEEVAAPSAPVKPGNWLGIIAVICFVLAAAFIVKLSVDSGWLTPVRQICLAAIFGVSLIAAGLMLLKTDRSYASYLPGAGVIVLYLTVFAAHIIVGLISFHTAITLDCILSGICLYLFQEIKHDIYVLTAAVGAYAAPFVLTYDSFGSAIVVTDALNQGIVFTIYYFLFCSLVFSLLGIWAQSRTLIMISAYLAMVANAEVGMYFARLLQLDTLVEMILIAQFFIFSIATYLYTYINETPLTSLEASSFFPVLLVFYAVEYYFINQNLPSLAPWISLGLAVFLISLCQGAKKWFAENSVKSYPMIISFATIVFVHSVYIELLPDTVRPWLFVILVVGCAFVPDRYLQSTSPFMSEFRIPCLAALGIAGIEYGEILSHAFGNLEPLWLLLSLAAFLSIWILFVAKHRFMQNDNLGYVVLIAAHLPGIAALYQLTWQYGSLVVSIAWLIYAVGVMALAIVGHDKLMAKSSLLILAFAAAKALLYDVASAPTLVRILCLLITGVVLYGAGLFIRKIAEWK